MGKTPLLSQSPNRPLNVPRQIWGRAGGGGVGLCNSQYFFRCWAEAWGRFLIEFRTAVTVRTTNIGITVTLCLCGRGPYCISLDVYYNPSSSGEEKCRIFVEMGLPESVHPNSSPHRWGLWDQEGKWLAQSRSEWQNTPRLSSPIWRSVQEASHCSYDPIRLLSNYNGIGLEAVLWETTSPPFLVYMSHLLDHASSSRDKHMAQTLIIRTHPPAGHSYRFVDNYMI